MLSSCISKCNSTSLFSIDNNKSNEKKNSSDFIRKSKIKNGKLYFKASSVDYGMKISIIIYNSDKYSISDMC